MTYFINNVMNYIKNIFKNKINKKIFIFLFTLLTTLTIFLKLQPKQNEKPIIGFNFNLYIKENLCYHIHHWIYMLFIVFIIISTVILSDGEFTEYILFFLGILIGGSLSDLAYTDFLEFKNQCH